MVYRTMTMHVTCLSPARRTQDHYIHNTVSTTPLVVHYLRFICYHHQTVPYVSPLGYHGERVRELAINGAN